MNQIKLKRIESQIVKEVSDILLNETNDDLMKTITITGCEVASDLSSAKIYFTSISDMENKAIEAEMEEASSYIRMKLADQIELRHTPKLRFIYDTSIAYGEKIERIIREINEDKKEDNND